MKTAKQVFKSFPEFSKMTLADKEDYEKLIASYPPSYDISFSGLMTWWNSLDNMAVSVLNENLIIPYWIPGDDKHSGLTLVGTANVDETICALFDYLRSRGEPVQLVNVPEFVVKNIRYYDLFSIKHHRKYDEYIFPVSRFYPLKNMKSFWRYKIVKTINTFGEEKIITKSLDLAIAKNRKLLIDATRKWQQKGINDYGKFEKDNIFACINSAEALNIENVCLFVDDVLYGFCLYETPFDKRYVTIDHIKATQKTSLGFELMSYMFAKWFSEHGFLLINLNSDYGKLPLRMFMLTLGPSNFFRKYTIRPIT